MALFPLIAGAIMGTRRNPNFDPYDPNSREAPFEVPQSGFGRFMQRYGGFDPVAANINYESRAGAASQEAANRLALQQGEQAFRRQLFSDQRGHDWDMAHSRLANDAMLRQYDAQQRAREWQMDRDARMAQLQEQIAAQQQMAEQEAALRRDLAQIPLQQWRNLGQFGVVNPSGEFYPYIEGGTMPTMGTDPITGKPTVLPPEQGRISSVPFGSPSFGGGGQQSAPPNFVSTEEVDGVVQPPPAAPSAAPSGRGLLGVVGEALNYPYQAISSPAESLKEAFIDPGVDSMRPLVSRVGNLLNEGQLKVGGVDVSNTVRGLQNVGGALGTVWDNISRLISRRKKEEPTDATLDVR